MSVNTKDKDVTHLAYLSVDWILEVMVALRPPATDTLPAIELQDMAICLEGCHGDWLMGLDAVVQKKLGFLEV